MIVNTLQSVAASARESRSLPTSATGWRELAYGLWGSESESGAKVSDGTAYSLPTAYACVKLMSEVVGHLPFELFRRSGEKAERVTDHPASQFADLYNPGCTSFEGASFATASRKLRGNSLAFVERTGREERRLYPLNWKYVTPVSRGGRVLFDYQPESGGGQVFDESEVWHSAGISPTGSRIGISPVQAMRETFGQGITLRSHLSRFFKNSAQPGGFLSFPAGTELSDTAYERAKTSWNETHQGVANTGRAALLEGGATWHSVGMSQSDAQWLESQKYNDSKVCAIWGDPSPPGQRRSDELQQHRTREHAVRNLHADAVPSIARTDRLA